MPSYIYISSSSSDPGAGRPLNDPLFGAVPTLGACVPNLRRQVTKGDWVFVVSGRRANVQQYLIGGIRVSEKISAIAAYQRFPEYRMSRSDKGHLIGNVPVDGKGRQHPLDNHAPDGFDRRVENYLVGDRSVHLSDENEIDIGRGRTLNFLSGLRNRPANRVIDVIGRASKLEDEEVKKILAWFDQIKKDANG